jgi:hypothetical protein
MTHRAVADPNHQAPQPQPVPLLFGELVVLPAICYLVTDFFRGAAAKHPSLAADANLPSSDTNRSLLLGDAVAS